LRAFVQPHSLILDRAATRDDDIREGVLTLTLDMMNPAPEIGQADADRVGPTLGIRA
jgi:hypothetical protein